MRRLILTCCLVFVLWISARGGFAEEARGRIVGPDEKPVAARLFYTPQGAWVQGWRETPVAPDGTFRVELEKPKSVSANVRADDPGQVVAWSEKYGVIGKLLKPGQENVIRFGPTRAIQGTMRDDKGQAAANVQLRVTYFYSMRGADEDERISNAFHLPKELEQEYSARTDAKGLWQIKGLPKEAYVQVEVIDPEYQSARTQLTPNGDSPGPYGNSFKALRAGKVAGRVLDEKGAPLEGARVVAVAQTDQKSTYNWGGTAQTDAAGRYTISSLAPGVYNLVLASFPSAKAKSDDKATGADAEDRVAKAIEGVRVEAAKTASAGDLNCITPAWVKGKVLDRDSGAPIKGVYVAAYNAASPRSGEPSLTSLTDSEGRFELTLAPGPAALFVRGHEFYRRQSEKEAPAETRVELVAGQTKTQSLFYTPKTIAVSGHAVDEKGAPVTDAMITIGREARSGRLAFTDETGAFEFPSLELGAMVVSVSGRRSAAYDLISPKTLTISRASAKTPLKIVLHRVPTMELKGRVVTPQSTPVTGVTVNYRLNIKMEDGNPAWTIRKATTDAAGYFSLGKARTSETASLISIEKPGYKQQSGGAVTIKNGAAKISDIVLQPLQSSLAGIVRDAQGNPAAGALVRAAGDEYSEQAVTDAVGNFTLNAQPDGAPGVLLAAHGQTAARQEFAKGQPIELQLSADQPENFPDVERAIAAFQEAANLSIDRYTLEQNAAALALFDPDTALTLAMQAGQMTNTRKTTPDTPDQSRLFVLRSLLRAAPSAPNQQWALAQLDIIRDENLWSEAATLLALAVSPNDAPLAEQLFERAQKRRVQNGGVGDDAAALARLAALALRMDKPEAEALHQAALKTAGDDTKNVIALFALASPSWVDEAIAPLPLATQLSKLDDAIRVMARWNPTGANELLDNMARLLASAPPETQKLWSGTFARSSKSVIFALGPTNPQVAHEIARAVDHSWNRASALAMAAQFGSEDERIAMAQEAAEAGGPMNSNGTLARLGGLLRAGNTGPKSQKVGEEIFQRAKNKIDLGRRQRGEVYGLAEYAFYLAATDPALARMELEAHWPLLARRRAAREYSRNSGDDGSWEGAQIAAAMAAIDFNRALEMANALPAEVEKPASYSSRAKALSDIGRIALTPAEDRWKFAWSDESGFDMR